MSKYQAVCATLRDGVTRPADGVAHAKERYGVEMTPNQFSAHKTRAVLEKVIPAEPTGEAEPAKQSEAVKSDSPKPPKPAAPKPESKQEAPTPPALKPVTPKAEAKAPPAPKAEPEAAPTPKLAAKAPEPAASPADLARQVKQLVALYGADAVRDMTGVFEG